MVSCGVPWHGHMIACGEWLEILLFKALPLQ